MAKRIGIIGGLSYESTIEFYKQIHEKYYALCKNYHYPEVVIFSLDFQKLINYGNDGKDEEYINYVMEGVHSLEKAGADFIVMASNAPHAYFDQLQEKAKVPMISIAEVTAQKVKKRGLKKLLLLGTKITMQSSFYNEVCEKYNIKIITPEETEQDEIDRIIFQELVLGKVQKASKEKVLSIIESYEVDGVILGCTELPLLIKQKDTRMILLDTLDLHTSATLEYALEKGKY